MASATVPQVREVTVSASPSSLLESVSTIGIEKIEELLAYRNAAVIERFAFDKMISYDEAEEVFVGLMQYVIACTFTAGYKTPSMIIDEMWHTFVLHMKDYERFCEEQLGGRVLYHDPGIDDSAFAHYPETRAIAAEFCGDLNTSVWPAVHDPHPRARCVSSGFTEEAFFG